MKRISGYVYGHYDSRGGTSFVAASSKTEADAKYFNYFWAGLEQELSQADWWEGISAYVDEDFMCEAVLHVPDDFDPSVMHGQDLEGIPTKLYEEESAKVKAQYGDQWFKHTDKIWQLPVWGTVVATGEHTTMKEVEEADDDFLDTGRAVGPIDLEFVPTGMEPKVVTKFCNPRWDDDAYNFVFIDKDTAESIKAANDKPKSSVYFEFWSVDQPKVQWQAFDTLSVNDAAKAIAATKDGWNLSLYTSNHDRMADDTTPDINLGFERGVYIGMQGLGWDPKNPNDPANWTKELVDFLAPYEHKEGVDWVEVLTQVQEKFSK